MEYYALLTAATIIIAVLAAVLYRRSHDLGTLVGTVAMYYWSLYGAWFVVMDKLGGHSGKAYHYLEVKMFPVALDGDYLLTIALYAVFIISLQLTMLALAPHRKQPELPRVRLRHGPIIIVTALAGIVSYFLMRDQLATARALNTSAYWYTRSHPNEWFTLHQVLNRVSMLPAAIGLAMLQTGARNRYFVNVRTSYTAWGYAVVLAGMAAFTFTLGNKNEVLTALLAGVLAYVGSQFRPNWGKVAVAMFIGAWFLFSIDYFRGFALGDLSNAISREEQATEVGRVGTFVASSNEAYAAHFSLYGVLSRNVEPKFGYSLYALALSAVPKILWPDRPRDIYYYYSESVGAMQGQGYSVHHATGWYLNFGYIGVVLGAMLLGMTWSFCVNARYRIRQRTSLSFRLFAISSPWFFAAALPPMLRSGPEGYKAIVLEVVCIPVAMLLLGTYERRRRNQQRLIWNERSGWELQGGVA
jgi:hypothetical protein